MVVTLAELKGYLGLDTADTSRDTALTKLVNQAQGEVENILGYPLETSTVTAEQRDYAPVVIPMRQPVASLTAKYRADLTDASQDVTLVEWTDYIVSTNGYGISKITLDVARLEADAWSNAKRLILAYTAGWAIASVPEPIKFAVTILAAFKLRLNDPQAPVLEGVPIGDPALKIMPKVVRENVTPYCKLRLP